MIKGLGKEEPSNGPYAFFRLFSGNPCPQQSWDLHISLNPALIHDPGKAWCNSPACTKSHRIVDASPCGCGMSLGSLTGRLCVVSREPLELGSMGRLPSVEGFNDER